MRSGCYEIVNRANGKRYIGSSVDVDHRMRAHRSRLDRCVHHSPILQRAWDKHGSSSFEFRRLLICAPADLLMYEQILIDFHCPEYNVLKVAGSALGRAHTEETKAKMRAAAIGRVVVIDQSTREKISAALKGRRKGPMSDETKAKVSASKTGVKLGPYSPERIEAAAAALRGRKLSLEHVANNAAARRGRKQTPEHIAKAAASRTGTKRSQETREKMSIAQLARYEIKRQAKEVI